MLTSAFDPKRTFVRFLAGSSKQAGTMTNYEDLKRLKGTGTPIDGLVPIAPLKARLLRESFPSIPDDYLAFLEEIGAGDVGDSAFVLYDGLVEPHEIFGDGAGMKGVLLFGDDCQGYCAGFDLGDWSVVEVDPTNRIASRVAEGFRRFMADRLATLQGSRS